MESKMTAIEMTGTVDERRQLRLDDTLPIVGPMRVRVLVLYPADDLDEDEWRRAAARDPAFHYLHDAREDIYTLSDGKAYNDEV
jgi:hypothetical protein